MAGQQQSHLPLNLPEGSVHLQFLLRAVTPTVQKSQIILPCFKTDEISTQVVATAFSDLLVLEAAEVRICSAFLCKPKG